jgi:hypothetical protein
VAVAALLLWLCTAAVGSYLLATSVRSGNTDPAPPAPGESVQVPAEHAAAAGTDLASAAAFPVPAPAPERRARARDRFDPPSLQRAKSEPLPGMKELAEFAHPALAMIGVGFWLGYVVSRDRLFAVIGLGVLLGAIGAGLSWFTANTRAARRAAAAGADSGTDSGTGARGAPPLAASPRLLILHATGAALTLLFAVLIAVRA